MKPKTFFGHPSSLSTLFATEFWERFSYYGMRAMLTLYLTATLIDGGFGMDMRDATAIYGIFTALVYITPIFGGLIADKILGQRVCVYIGALTMAVGQFALASTHFMGTDAPMREFALYLGLGVLIAGNGFFKSSISTMVGQIYPANDPRRDGGFTIFYMGINAGAFVSPLIAGGLGEKVGWGWGFLAAGIGMLVGTVWFYLRRRSIYREEDGRRYGVGLPPNMDPDKELFLDYRRALRRVVLWTLGTLLLASSITGIVYTVDPTIMSYVYWIIGLGALGYIFYTIITGTRGKTEWSRVLVIFTLSFFVILFWAGFEQAGTSFNYFARDNTDRVLFGWELPATWLQTINSTFILVLAPVFTFMWTYLSRVGRNISTPFKFFIGLLLLSVSFFLMSAAYNISVNGSGDVVKVSMLWLVGVYVLQTMGELCLSPIGLSMVTKLSPPKIVTVMMGVWMMASAVGNFVAQKMEQVAEAIAPQTDMFTFIAWQSLAAALLLLCLVPFLRRAMKGVN